MDEVERLKKGMELLKGILPQLKELGFDSITDFMVRYNNFVKNNVEKVFVKAGECNRCGKCCELANCPHYAGNGVCKIYEDRPDDCKEYPPLLLIVTKSVPEGCGYYAKMRDDCPDELKDFDFSFR